MIAITSQTTLASDTAALTSGVVEMRTIEEALAIGTLMSDSEAIKFGFMNFDLKVDDPGFGDDDTIQLKNSLDIIVVPYTWDLPSKKNERKHAISLRASFIKIKRENDVDEINGELEENTFSLYGNYSQYFHLTDYWYVESALGLHLSYYQNMYRYGDDVAESIKEQLDNVVFNVSTLALIAEPEVGIGYQKNETWGKWRAHNNLNYIYGHGISGSYKRPSKINPEGWRITNGIEFAVEVPDLWGIDDFLSIDFKRIDLLGDMQPMADNKHYYETSFGWVIDTNNNIPLLDNIGIGFSVNYGSSISGGTVVLYFNE